MTARRSVIAIVVAAGKGVRAGDGPPKQHRLIHGASALTRSLALLASRPGIDGVLPVIRPGDETIVRDAIAAAAARQGVETTRFLAPVHGGAERQESVANALEALAARPAPPSHVLVHDAARPFAPPAMIDRILAALGQGDERSDGSDGADAVCPALPVVDTLRRAEDGRAGDLVDRSGLVRAQTPQGFAFAPLLAAHRANRDAPATDDAELARRHGLTVALVEGSEEAFKITTAEDFARAESLAALSDGETRMGAYEYRSGTGFDVHAFGPNADGSRDHVWLCGIKVPHEDGLKGHSDADVALHALTDALLGALAMGDIGAHFPPSEEAWRGAASDRFLRFAAEAVRERGGRIAHLDVTLICERPKIRPHVAAMRARVAEIAEVALDRVSVKATTTEGLGFTGRREGVAAMAAASVALPAAD